jgi:hypothetical protein
MSKSLQMFDVMLALDGVHRAEMAAERVLDDIMMTSFLSSMNSQQPRLVSMDHHQPQNPTEQHEKAVSDLLHDDHDDVIRTQGSGYATKERLLDTLAHYIKLYCGGTYPTLGAIPDDLRGSLRGEGGIW